MSRISYRQDEFSGGIASTKYRGIKNSVANLENINLHKNSNSLEVNQALKTIGSSTVTDLITTFIAAKGYIFAFGNTGKIYKIDGETVTLVYNDTNGAIRDAAFFYDKIYWTTDTNISRCAYDSTNWSVDTDHNWQTLNSCSYHPMYTVGNWLFIGDDRYISTVSDSEAYQAQALDIYKDWTIRALNLIKPLLLIGTSNSGRSKCMTWDFLNSADSFEELPGLESGLINEFEAVAGAVLATVNSKLYYYDGLGDSALFDFDENITGVTFKNNKIYLLNKNGVYSYGRKNKNYPSVPNIEHSIDNVDTSGDIIGTSDNLYVSYKDTGGNYYLKCIDSANKASQGVIELRVLKEKYELNIRKVKYYFESLPADTSIQIKYKTEEHSSWQTIEDPEDDSTLITNTTDKTKDTASIGCSGKEFQARIELNTNQNDSPIFKEIIIIGETKKN